MTDTGIATISHQDLAARISSVMSQHYMHVLSIGGVQQISPDEGPSLARRAKLVSDTFQENAIPEHPLRSFFSAALSEMTLHAAAIDMVLPSRAAVLHGRQLEEIATTARFVVSEVGRYNEFAWRWREFKAVHAIRNRLFNLKQPLDLKMQNWIDDNLPQLQTVKKQFTGDPSKDASLWRKYSNWLYPVYLGDIFEKTGAAQSYFFRQYEWSSHSVHLSPMGGYYEGFELSSGMSYVEFVVQGSIQSVDSMASIALGLVADRKRMRVLHTALVLLALHHMNETNPKALAEAASKSPQFRRAIGEIMRDPPNLDRLTAMLVGKEPEDPLVVQAGQLRPKDAPEEKA